MRIAVVGGKLQGVEAVYLAKKAGYETLLIDRNRDVPARGICQSFIEFNFLSEEHWPQLSGECGKIDLIFPALEDVKTLELLEKWADHIHVPIVLDIKAYHISQSKIVSNAIFEELGLAVPANAPGCSFPLLVKPDRASGSKGVVIAHTQQELDSAIATSSQQLVIQEYLEGPSFSLEVIGKPENYITLQVTDLFMDRDYDCCGVAAPTFLNSALEKQFHQAALNIAEKISLYGIMDVEVILHNNELKILEIDARFPSQTPIAVYLSTGMNFVEMLAGLFISDHVEKTSGKAKYVRLDHIRVNTTGIEVCGEHIMTENGFLRIVPDFFGADEALTSYIPETEEWVATLLLTGNCRDDVENKRRCCHEKILSDTLDGGIGE